MVKTIKIKFLLSIALFVATLLSSAYRSSVGSSEYVDLYAHKFNVFQKQLIELNESLNSGVIDNDSVIQKIHKLRLQMKTMDFWWRYSNPLAYKSINAPLPIEWETEVFEKFEAPYKRVGAGLSLAELALEESDVNRNEIKDLIQPMLQAMEHLQLDTLQQELENPSHFYFCNRLYLLNLSSIYSTGFECPDTSNIVPELKQMCNSIYDVYLAYNQSHNEFKILDTYLNKYKDLLVFLQNQSNFYSNFNHFVFLRDYVNPLYKINAAYILEKSFWTKNLNDYSLNKKATSIFDKGLYSAQFGKGVYARVTDSATLNQISELGKLFFFDPILSGNNQRSCSSCHLADQFFTDTSRQTAIKFNHNGQLARNTPSLVNADMNHLLMVDGKHLTLQEQAIAVMCNPDEMGGNVKDIMKKVLSVDYYAKALKKLNKLTPQFSEPRIEHIASAITYFYSRYSRFSSPFDLMVQNAGQAQEDVIKGFNLFMSKAQCATCHFVPQFNGVKPPFIGSEFEVLGVPQDTGFLRLDKDSGRYKVYAASEMLFAFRTGSIRNIEKTAPYMHNGVFKTLEEVMVFYNNGGGAGRGLEVSNQTLSGDKLGLSNEEIRLLIVFMKSLNEDIEKIEKPTALPLSKKKTNNKRTIGGDY